MKKILVIIFVCSLSPNISFADYIRTGPVKGTYETWFTISHKEVNYYQMGNKRYKFPTRFKNYEIDDYNSSRCWTRLFSGKNLYSGSKNLGPTERVVFPCRPV